MSIKIFIIVICLLSTTSLAACQPTLPPASLFEPIFADGSDDPGPGNVINPANTWADFVYTTVIRYRPQGRLAARGRGAEQPFSVSLDRVSLGPKVGP